ncbi:MAG: FecR domain-containing protein [Chitinophagaceae bacterium]|nr:FecR domain-containing protein [Chitinophagaceae bacterium]MCW5927600.1 FecR domain-containing protein [Chitinophagaceae bacterium]
MNRSRLQYLLRRYGENIATPSELEELTEFLRHSEEDTLFSEVLVEELKNAPGRSLEDLKAYETLADRVLEQNRTSAEEPFSIIVYKRNWFRWAAAACILLLVSAVIYVKQHSNPATQSLAEKTEHTPPVILPGKNGAILTLADGSSIVLDSLGNGKITSQNGTDVIMQDGKLAYTIVTSNSTGSGYNTLSTPKGRQYQIRLHDGTEVWLNAASSIRYPTVFSGGERIVEVTGEAYFEVTKDAARPFKVKLNQQAEIAVLGTQFNVNAYHNEPAITTTLLEGSIRFSTYNDPLSKKEKVLRPGQQTKLDNQTFDLTTTNNVEIAQVIAWKNGIFDFNGAGVEEVMQQLERWYDIEVTYKKGVPDIRFFGKMTKNLTLNDLLVILEKSNVHFKIEGRKITVTP